MKKYGWDIKRNLTKINYGIHTDSIKNKLIPDKLSNVISNKVYASEADILNMALFGMTAKEWQQMHPKLKGNIRDYASGTQLVCLTNLESLNSIMINEGKSQKERIKKLICNDRCQEVNQVTTNFLLNFLKPSCKGFGVSVPGFGHSDIRGLVTYRSMVRREPHRLIAWITDNCANIVLS